MSSREEFEAWLTAEQWFHGSDFEWDDRRNCYSQFGIHLAYKAWQKATKAIEAKCAALAAENTSLKGALNKIAFTYSLSPHIHEMTTIATPDTDAFLAEVRAQGVDQFKECMRTTGYPWEGDWHGIGRMTDSFSAQLRQDANTADLLAAGIITKVGE